MDVPEPELLHTIATNQQRMLRKIPNSSILRLVTAMLLCAAGNAHAQTLVPKTDTQSWNDIQVTIPLNKKAELVLLGTLRIGGNLTTFVDEREGVRFNYLIEKCVTLQALYFHRDAKPPNGKHEREERVTFGANLRVPVGKFALNSRNWFERRWRNPQVDAWRYRNRVQLERPFKIGKAKLTWFVNDEFFYDWSLDGWVRNRFAVGASHVFNKHLTLDVYAMRQNDGRTRPGDVNIIGTVTRFRL
jgi:hypothetical protein